MSNIAVLQPIQSLQHKAEDLSQTLDLTIVAEGESEQFKALLIITPEHLALKLTGTAAPGPVSVDFTGGKYAHRRQYGGGKGQLIAKAIGLGTLKKPQVLDLTAGLGQDAFVMACLGCSVQMIERSPIIAALVQDALTRAKENPDFSTLNLTLINANSLDYLSTLSPDDYPEVIYIDPMFPHRTKSALVKKEMRVLRSVVGEDPDSAALLKPARAIAKKRVVVKRPRLAPHLDEQIPDCTYRGQSSRFDVYLAKNKAQ